MSARGLLRTTVAVATLATIAAACSGSGGLAHGCPSGFLGDPAATPSFTFLARTAAGTAAEIVESDGAPLLPAPQGGFVLFAGIRATNVDSCALNVTGALRDETTNLVIGLEGRPIRLVATSGGYGVPDDPAGLENWSNIPVCPSAAATRGILGTSYRLEMQITDRGGRTASGSLHVVPFCGDASQYCMAVCSSGTAALVR